MNSRKISTHIMQLIRSIKTTDLKTAIHGTHRYNLKPGLSTGILLESIQDSRRLIILQYKGSFDFSSLKAVVERPDLWSVLVNGTEVKPEAGKWWLDREFSVFNIGSLVRKGDNTITLKATPMKVHAEIEPVYILGDFSVKPSEKGWTIEPSVKSLTTGSWKEQGMPFYSWGVTYSKEYDVENPEGTYECRIR